MAAPVVTSIAPSTGLAVGDGFVEIDGTGFNLVATGTVTVTFGGKPARRVGVASSTLVLAIVPPGDPGDPTTDVDAGKVDVVVSNVTPQLVGPPLVEPTTVVQGFRYIRGPLETPANFSNHGIVALVVRTLVSEFRRAVLKNAWHDLHPDYADADAAAAGETERAKAPSLKIVGPKIREDRENSRNEPVELDRGSGDWSDLFPSRTVELRFDLVGIARTPEEASRLWGECVRYFSHVDFLPVPVPSSKIDPTELALYELEADWSGIGDFRSHATRQGLAQFTLTFYVRGVTINPDELAWASREADLLVLDAFELQGAPLAPIEGVPVDVVDLALPHGQTVETALETLDSRVTALELGEQGEQQGGSGNIREVVLTFSAHVPAGTAIDVQTGAYAGGSAGLFGDLPPTGVSLPLTGLLFVDDGSVQVEVNGLDAIKSAALGQNDTGAAIVAQWVSSTQLAFSRNMDDGDQVTVRAPA